MTLWLKNYVQNLSIKGTVILYGNVKDYCKSENGNYVTSESEALNILQKNSKKIIHYDVISGIKFINMDEKGIYECLREYNRERYSYSNGSVEINHFQTPNRGRRGFDDDSEQRNNLCSGMSAVEEDLKSVDNFFNFMNEVVNSNLDVNFFISNADYIFGELINGEASTRENALGILNNLVNSVEKIRENEITSVKRNIVLVLKNISNLPSRLHIGNVKVSKIVVPLPGIKERNSFYRDNIEKFSISIEKQNDFLDSLDGLTLLEIEQIGLLSKSDLENDGNKIISRYRYGNVENIWMQLEKYKLYNLEEEMKKRVKGQDLAVKKIKDIIIKAYTGISGLQHSSKNIKPKGTLFFVGPTGVGKTELAKTLAESIFGDENACIRFDMSEYNTEHSDQRLIGPPPGYVGYEAGGQLTNKVKEKPFSVLLFDEIEKAHPRILDKFLQILEDGRLTDGKGETVYFTDTIIIFTSNIGTSVVTSNDDEAEIKFKKAVENHFKMEIGRPEILNRIGLDNIVVFDFIRKNEILRDIVVSKLKNVDDFLREKYNGSRLEIVDRDQVFLQLVSRADKTYGGRGALNDMEKYFITPFSYFLFEAKEELDKFKNRVITAKYSESLSEFEFSID